MTIRVRETLGGRGGRAREIDFSLRIYAGAARRSDVPLDPDVLLVAAEAVRWQIISTWLPFYLAEEGIEYSFRFRFETAPHEPTVARWKAGIDQVPDQGPDSISVADAFHAAHDLRCDNIAVLFPYWRTACAPRFDRSNRFVGGAHATTEHADTFIATSTVMALSVVHLMGGGNLTAAHEAGHLMGLPDGVYDWHTIMRSDAHDRQRSMTERDQIRLHHAIDLPIEGVNWHGPRLPTRRPHARRRRHR